MKKCHYCAEEIQDGAIKCKHCGEWLNNDLPTNNPKKILETKRIASSDTEFYYWRTLVYSVISLVLIFSAITWLFDGFDENYIAPLLWIIALASLTGILVTNFIRGLKSSSELTEEDRNKYNGLEGWLTLVILGLIVGLGYNMLYFLEIFNGSSSNDSMIFDIVIGIVFVVFNAFVIYLFFTKKRIFPVWYIAFLIINAVLNFLAFFLVGENTTETANISEDAGKSILAAIIWVPYMLKSKRVKATFTK